MFLRRNRRRKNGESYEYWTLVESVRTSRGPRQRIVATIGKWPGLDESTRVGWEHIADILDGKARQEDFLKPAQPDPPQWAAVDVKEVQVERLCHFGEVYLGLALWRRLDLDRFFNDAMKPGREQIPWSTMACILVLARLKARIEAPTRTLRHRDPANRRIGRMFQGFSRAAHLYDVEISEIADPDHKSGKRLSLDISVREDLRQWVEQSDGCYLLRTNIQDMPTQFLWKTYIDLTEVEDCFSISKYGVTPNLPLWPGAGPGP